MECHFIVYLEKAEYVAHCKEKVSCLFVSVFRGGGEEFVKLFSHLLYCAVNIIPVKATLLGNLLNLLCVKKCGEVFGHTIHSVCV